MVLVGGGGNVPEEDEVCDEEVGLLAVMVFVGILNNPAFGLRWGAGFLVFVIVVLSSFLVDLKLLGRLLCPGCRLESRSRSSILCGI